VTGRVAVVTGAGRGIGLATAKRFLAEGWRVALLDIDLETLTATVAELAGDTLACIATWPTRRRSAPPSAGPPRISAGSTRW